MWKAVIATWMMITSYTEFYRSDGFGLVTLESKYCKAILPILPCKAFVMVVNDWQGLD